VSQGRRHGSGSVAAIAAAAAAVEAAPSSRDQQHAAPAAALDGELRFPDSYYDNHSRLVLKNLTLPELEAWCTSIGQSSPPSRFLQKHALLTVVLLVCSALVIDAPCPELLEPTAGEDGPKRALQLWRFMYYDRQWVRSLDDAAVERVQNGFSAAFRAKVAGLVTLDAGLELQSVHTAADGTRKMVFRLAHGPAAGGQVKRGATLVSCGIICVARILNMFLICICLKRREVV
jgi:23S rRNA (adenine2503-C2)-methyltransferase